MKEVSNYVIERSVLYNEGMDWIRYEALHFVLWETWGYFIEMNKN